jgi:hypothetical protein
MAAQIVILAEYRERRARLEVSYDPLALWRAWWALWMAYR